MRMQGMDKDKLKDMLLQSLYDYHFANNGAAYRLPIAMVNTDPNSKVAIDELIENGFATNSGEGTEDLLLAITEAGLEYIKQKSN